MATTTEDLARITRTPDAGSGKTPATTDKRTTTNKQTTTDKHSKRVLPLDGVRAFAIIGVVLYHLHVPYFQGGFVGVNVFFVLSGYLITSLLLREHALTATIKLGRFWVRRILRLYPILIAVVVVGIALWAFVGDYGYMDLSPGGAALVALSYTGNFVRSFGHLSQGVFAPSWSLAMEEQFYLVWPPVLAFLLSRGMRRRSLAWWLVALTVVSSALGWLVYDTPQGIATPDVYFSPVSNVAPLMMGCILALALTHDRARRMLGSRLGSVMTWFGGAGILAIMFGMTDDWQQQAQMFWLVLPLVGLFSALMIGGMVCRPSVPARVLAWRPIAWFGRNVSYPLYLWHVLVLALLEPYVHGLIGKFAVVAAAIVVAVASHFAIEKPFLRLKKRFEPASWSAPFTPEPTPRIATASLTR